MNIELYKQALKERGWTYKDLAEKTNISHCNISRIMAGIVSNPHYSTIEAIEKALGINLYDVTTDERAAGAILTRKANITPIEDEMLFQFREVGKRRGEDAQRALITIAENMK